MTCDVAVPAFARVWKEYEAGDRRLPAFVIGVEQVDCDPTACLDRVSRLRVALVVWVAERGLPEACISRRDVEVALLVGERRRVRSAEALRAPSTAPGSR